MRFRRVWGEFSHCLFLQKSIPGSVRDGIIGQPLVRAEVQGASFTGGTALKGRGASAPRRTMGFSVFGFRFSVLFF